MAAETVPFRNRQQKFHASVIGDLSHVDDLVSVGPPTFRGARGRHTARAVDAKKAEFISIRAEEPHRAFSAISAGAQTILDGIRKRWPWVKHLFADGAYDRLQLMDKAAYLEFVIEVIRCSDKQVGFEVLPRRWVVERTFGWMTRWRRLVRDYETRLDVSEAMILVAMGGNLLRRNTHL